MLRRQFLKLMALASSIFASPKNVQSEKIELEVKERVFIETVRPVKYNQDSIEYEAVEGYGTIVQKHQFLSDDNVWSLYIVEMEEDSQYSGKYGRRYNVYDHQIKKVGREKKVVLKPDEVKPREAIDRIIYD